MSNDRELLELAAKAAGLKVRIWDGHTGAMCAIDDDRHGRMWMPLADDGDALRLAVMLSMNVDVGTRLVEASIIVCDIRIGAEQLVGNDKFAATRRAIVRAAAEIGRNLP